MTHAELYLSYYRIYKKNSCHGCTYTNEIAPRRTRKEKETRKNSHSQNKY